MSRSSKKPPDQPTRMVNVDDVRQLQKDARTVEGSELEKLQAELEATRFALHRESEKTKELEKRLAVAKDAVFVRHQRIAELESRLKNVREASKRLEDEATRVRDRISELTKPD